MKILNILKKNTDFIIKIDDVFELLKNFLVKINLF